MLLASEVNNMLDIYDAYAPPFRWNPSPDCDLIGGLSEKIPYDKELCDRLNKAWYDEINHSTTKEWKIPSQSTVGVWYTVRKTRSGWVCSCPSRLPCWHVKVCKSMDEEKGL